jgi:hypothetical protein
VLVAAHRNGCHFLVTFNVRDYSKPPESLAVMEPGELVQRVRAHLAELAISSKILGNFQIHQRRLLSKCRLCVPAAP